MSDFVPAFDEAFYLVNRGSFYLQIVKNSPQLTCY